MDSYLVASSGVHLRVRRSGLRGGPSIILVHGFPDNQHTWDKVVPLLEPYFQVVTYDVRGAGGSSAPSARHGYRMHRLVDDLIAVIERVRPDGGPVHLVGHDWGSVQLWAAVLAEGADARLHGRISSFTSISGPALNLFGHFFATALRHRQWGPLMRQLRRSWYVLAFQLPLLPEFAFGRFGGRIRQALSRRQGLRGHWTDSFEQDAIHGVNLYRQNRLRFGAAHTDVPVQLIVPTRDAFLTPAVYADLARFAPRSTRFDIAAGHWVTHTHAEAIAERIRTFAQQQEGSQESDK